MQLYVTDYFINALLYGLNANDLIHLPVHSKKLTTTLLGLLIGNSITRVFGSGMPCMANIWTQDPAPSVAFNAAGDTTLNANITMQILC